ncbi:UNVERIFIED_CONTAM: hypothetical protein FKN15_041274 [Acipenser sinensis]
MYAVVLFKETEEVKVVPSVWLSVDKLLCLWPSYKSTVRVRKAVELQETPTETWDKHEVWVLHETVTYEKARKKLRKATETSDLNTTDDEQTRMRKIQRWAVCIVYKAGKDHGNADALSRLPLPEGPIKATQEDRILLLDHMDSLPVIAAQIRSWTGKDPVLSRVCEYVLRGWPNCITEIEFTPFLSRKQELSVQVGCVLWGARVVVLKQGRQSVMEQLHQSHPGIMQIKGLARSYMWCPKMYGEIERKVQSCVTCQEHRKAPAVALLHPWEWPEKPWRRLHIDYAGPFLRTMFLVIVDVHSKWMDAYPVKKTSTSTATIEKLSFSNHGLPEMIVSDNGTPVDSALNPGTVAFQRKFVKEVKRCEEMERILCGCDAPLPCSSMRKGEAMVSSSYHGNPDSSNPHCTMGKPEAPPSGLFGSKYTGPGECQTWTPAHQRSGRQLQQNRPRQPPRQAPSQPQNSQQGP